MLRIENTDVYGWEAAIRGMRNPMNSWDKSDTNFDYQDCPTCPHAGSGVHTQICDGRHCVVIGENDLKLMKNLSKAGNDHGKFLRMINVTCDITAPLYWWKEFDTYKVGTVANSCSTMHKIHAKEFERGDFSCEHIFDFMIGDVKLLPIEVLDYTIDCLNMCRERYLETKDKEYWWQMIQLLPSSYNQKRTVQLNYQVLKSMYFARRNHKLDCWRTLCDWMLTLPYFKEVCVDVCEV